MNNFERIEADINDVQDWDQATSNELHDQLVMASIAKMTAKELSYHIMVENDVADNNYVEGTGEHAEIRDIQHAIIDYYGE